MQCTPTTANDHTADGSGNREPDCGFETNLFVLQGTEISRLLGQYIYVDGQNRGVITDGKNGNK